MKRIAAAIALLLAAVCAAGATAAATKDPRKCADKFGHTLVPAVCAHTAAVKAIEARFAAMPNHPTPHPACRENAPYLVVTCSVGDTLGGTWKAVVRFRGTPSGWRTTVTLTKIA